MEATEGLQLDPNPEKPPEKSIPEQIADIEAGRRAREAMMGESATPGYVRSADADTLAAEEARLEKLKAQLLPPQPKTPTEVKSGTGPLSRRIAQGPTPTPEPQPPPAPTTPNK